MLLSEEESVEDETSFNRSAFATPSVDPLDAAMAKLEEEMASGTKSTGQEPEKDVETARNATATGDPEDDDLDDDDETDVVNTPEDDVDPDDDDSLDPKQEKQPDSASTPDATKKKAQDSVDGSHLSRKERGKLITELREELAKEQEEKQALEDSLKSQREAKERLDKDVERALGSDNDYQKAMNDALSGDEKAQERVKVWKANREFYQKLVDKASDDSTTEFMNTYWKEVSGLPGVTQEALRSPSLSTILKSMYDAGVSSVKDASTEEVDKLKSDLDTWKGRYRSLKAKAGGSKASPLGGGGSTSTPVPVDWQKKYMDPKTGMLTDEAEAIVEQYGFAALANPKLIKR